MDQIWSELNQPATIAGLNLQNRYVMAPMTRNQSPGGVPTEEVAQYYERRADSLGLIITEGVYVDHPSAGASDQVPRLDSSAALAGWKRVLELAHGRGAKVFPQLWHLGGIRRAGTPPFPEAPVFTPSGIAMSGKTIGEVPTIAQIDAVVAAFINSAQVAQATGFDGIELHGAHGYLLDQFLWEVTNRRTDRYGGSLAARVQLSVEIVKGIREQVGPEFPIQFRFSQWKGGRWDARIADSPDDLAGILEPLAEAGVDIFHPSTRRFWQPAFAGSELTLSGWTKKITGKPAVMVGHVGVDTAFRADAPERDDPGDAEKAQALARLFHEGQFDLLAVGRALLADPEWVSKTVGGQPQAVKPYTKESESVFY